MNGQRIFTLLVVAIFFYMVSPLILPVLMGAIFAVLLAPVVKFLEGKKGPKWIAFFLTFFLTVGFILPLMFLVFSGTKSTFRQLDAIRIQAIHGKKTLMDSFLNAGPVQIFIEKFASFLPLKPQDLNDFFIELSSGAGAVFISFLKSFLAHLPMVAISLIVMMLSLYFFLTEQKACLDYLKRISVFSPTQTQRLLKTMGDMCRSVILASLFSGFIQAFLEWFACLVTGVPDSLLNASLVFCSSFLPIIGSTPVALWVAFRGFYDVPQTQAIILLIFTLIILFIDNLIRPLFLRGSTNLHPLLAFIAAFGGIQTIGFTGIFVGPIVASLFVVTLQILTTDCKG